MDKFVITGGTRLRGEVRANGSKNATLPIMAACILSEGRCVLKNVPFLNDIATMGDILTSLGMSVKRMPNSDLVIEPVDEGKCRADYKLVSTMRASICVLGPLLAKRKKAEVSMPGGCAIGIRPIDLHLKGLKKLGATMRLNEGYIVADGNGMKATEIYLGGMFGSTVTGTANILMGAVLTPGTTIIENAACEPEVTDLAIFLTRMGARIDGIGSQRLAVRGVKRLRGTAHSVIPDRIEAGTFLVGAAMTKGDVTVTGCRPDHLSAVLDKLAEAGSKVTKGKTTIRVVGQKRIKPVNIATLPYPGFPTDMQAQMCAMMAVADGISMITERIYPDRFMYVAELQRMGALINKEGPSVVVTGAKRMNGAEVMASDLRASAALVLAGAVATGRTVIRRVYHIDRGYEKIEEKMNRLGARIERKVDKKIVVTQ